MGLQNCTIFLTASQEWQLGGKHNSKIITTAAVFYQEILFKFKKSKAQVKGTFSF